MLEALNVMKRVADGINNFLPPVNKVLNTIDMKKLIETYGEVIKEVRKENLSSYGQNYYFFNLRVNCIQLNTKNPIILFYSKIYL